jgi:hypothetical protein
MNDLLCCAEHLGGLRSECKMDGEDLPVQMTVDVPTDNAPLNSKRLDARAWSEIPPKFVSEFLGKSSSREVRH